jgi:FixJ family two-component response regulator
MSVQTVATVFVVDDDDDVRDSLHVLLTAVGFRVEAFASAEDFLQRAPSAPTGCLILDLQMPGMGGWRLLERLSAQGTALPVIVHTAQVNRGCVRRDLKASAFDVLEKPCGAQRLIDCIRKALIDRVQGSRRGLAGDNVAQAGVGRTM